MKVKVGEAVAKTVGNGAEKGLRKRMKVKPVLMRSKVKAHAQTKPL